MAERRMLTKKVTDDDRFQDLSASAQALYLHLTMSADDDGFSNQVSVSMFKAHASIQDLQALLEKRYVYQFESGVIVIKDWRMANALRKDRYTPTIFQEELAQLGMENSGSYTWLPSGCQMVATGKDRQGKDSIGKDRISECQSTPAANVSEEVKAKALKALSATPTLDSVIKYCEERKNGVDAKRFFNYYEARGWETNGTPIRNWKALLNTWEPKESKDPDAADKRLKELKKKRDKLVREGAGKEELEVIDLNIQSVKDAMEAHNGK